jgi:hypothetical protein
MAYGAATALVVARDGAHRIVFFDTTTRTLRSLPHPDEATP